MKRKIIYWLCDKKTPQLQSRVDALLEKGVEAQFFNDIRSLLDYYTQKRVNVIVLSDDFEPKVLESNLEMLSKHPNFYGVRLIFSIGKNQQEFLEAAYELGYRDIIPVDLEPQQWVKRFQFSIGSVVSSMSTSSPQVQFKGIAGIFIPARLIWLSGKRMRLEARLKADKGTRLTIAGAIARHLGVKSLSLEVESRDRTNLRYRFSEAYNCVWQAPKDSAAKLKIIMDHLESKKSEFGVKIFAAVKSVEVRNKLLESLNSNEVILATALNKQHIITEPKYFGPQLVIIEDRLCKSGELSLFARMADNLPHGCPIVVLGEPDSLEELRSLAPSRRIYTLPKVRENLMNLIYQKYLAGEKWQKIFDEPGMLPVSFSSRFSPCEIYISSRLNSLHPSGASFWVPIPVGQFGMCRIESTLIKRVTPSRIYGKIVDSYHYGKSNEGMRNLIDVAFSNLSQPDRLRLGALIVDHLADKLKVNREKILHLESENKPRPKEPAVEVAKAAQYIGEEVFDKIADRTINLAESVRKHKSFQNFLPLFMVLVFLGIMAGTLYWLMLSYNPAESKSGATFSRELNRFQQRESP